LLSSKVREDMMHRTSGLTAVLFAAAITAIDAQPRRSEFQRSAEDWCDGGDSDRGYFCEVREDTLAGTNALDIDASPNGGIRVRGWDRLDIAIRSRVSAHADSDDEARQIVSQVRVDTGGGRVRAQGPTQRDGGWTVSYEVSVPNGASLTLNTENGGISVEDLSGAVRFRARNGGVRLENVGGDFRGETTNGGVNVELSGDRWNGVGLDVETSNGGVNLSIPANYSAELETGTVNGRLRIDFPVTVQGSNIARRINTTLGAGGPRIRAMTNNGGVNIRRR
jgi:hypothetical protein